MYKSRSAYKAAIPALKRDISESKKKLTLLESALLTMEALADGGEPLSPQALAPIITETGSMRTRRGRPRAGARTTIDVVEEIVRETGRPMHAVKEIEPALRARGYGYKHQASLISCMCASGRFQWVRRGTYALKSAGKEG
jgi:hypothetical protein